MARDLKLQVVLDAVDRVTRPLKKITEGSGRTAEALKASREQLKTLERAQKNLRGFRELKEQSEKTSTALDEQQREIRKLSRQMQSAEGDTEALGRKRAQAIRQARKLKERYQDEQRKLQDLRRGMDRVEGVTGSYSDRQRELSRRIREANGQLEAQQRHLRETAQRQRQAAQAANRYQRATSRASSVAGAGAVGTAAGGAAATLMTHQAFGNQINGARLAAQFGEGEPEAVRYREVITQVYRGGRGTDQDQVAEAVGALGAAFGSLEDQSADQLRAITEQALTLSDVFGIDVAEAAQTAGIMVQNGLARDASAAFDLIARGFQEVSGEMRQELPEILHEYSTNFRALGFDGQESMNLLVTAAEQGRFVLDKTGDALKEFTIRGSDMSNASVAAYEAVGLNAEAMANAIASGGDQARQALHTTARAILDIEDPARRANTAIALFGTPIEDLSIDQIPQFLEALTGAEDKLGNVTGATDAMAATLDNNAGTALRRVQRVISGEFMRVLDEVDDDIIAISRAVTGWIDENPELANTLTKVAAAVAVLVAVGGGFMAVLGSVLGPIAMVRYALTLLSLNPVSLTIMAIVAAVAALAAGAYLVYRNWDSISSWFSKRWQQVKDAFSGGIGGVTRLLLDWSPLGLLWRGISTALSALGIEVPESFSEVGDNIISGIIDGITGMAGALRDTVVGLASNIAGWMRDAISGAWDSGIELAQGFAGGVRDRASAAVDSAGDMAQGTIDTVRGWLDIHSPSRVFRQLGEHTMAGFQLGLKRGEGGPLGEAAGFAQRLSRTTATLTLGAATVAGSAALAAEVPLDTRPPLQASGGGDVHVTTGDIHIHAAPGMDEQALARLVNAEIQRALAEASRDAAARRRSAMWDLD